MIDIDHFKCINDDYGHAIGDEILKAFAKKLSEEVRDSDKLARFGGEAFILVMASTSLDEAERLAQRIRLQITQTQWSALPEWHNITISIGLTELMQQDSSTNLITRADTALYEAKRAGRNRVVIYS